MPSTAEPGDLLQRLERYYDAAPRASCETEEIGSFTLFVSHAGFPYYARPRLGLDPATRIGVADVCAVLERQRALGVPQSMEWVHEVTPGLLAPVRAAGMSVLEAPLLVLGSVTDARRLAPGVVVMGSDDPRLGLVRASIGAGFVGTDIVAEPADTTLLTERIATGLIVQVGAFDVEGIALGGGSHSPRDGVTEITGIAVLPRARNRGLGSAITRVLAADALDHGTTTVFLSAGSDAAARIYQRVGFVRVGTACIAERHPQAVH
ncbi:MAG: GNAT family N-acetyltransferase [Nocardioidaceae bacterium]